MKFRTMLLASAAVMFTSSAFAADITNPFFLPTQGKFLSDTSVEFSRDKMDNGVAEYADKEVYANETLSFGLTDNLALVGSIGNTFDVNEDYRMNNDHNFDYMLGVKYNHNFGKVLTQVGAYYWTADEQSFYGQEYDDDENGSRWDKEVGGYVQVGYDMGYGLTPYTSLSMNSEIDQSSREIDYSWFVGAHKMFDKVSVDGGFRYNFGHDTDNEGEEWYVEASANYFVTDNFTVGVYGDYYLGGNDRKDQEYDYTVGLNAKVLF